MDSSTLELLAEAGFHSTTTAEFLGMTPEEEAVAELKSGLTGLLRRARKARRITQAQLAKRMQTTQQVIARAENGHRSVSLDLLIEALLVCEVSLQEIANVIGGSSHRFQEQDVVQQHSSSLPSVRHQRATTSDAALSSLEHKRIKTRIAGETRASNKKTSLNRRSKDLPRSTVKKIAG